VLGVDDEEGKEGKGRVPFFRDMVCCSCRLSMSDWEVVGEDILR